MTALQRDTIPSWKMIMDDAFIALERSVHHTTILMETVSELNLRGEMHVMTCGYEIMTDCIHTLRKVTHRVKGIQDIVHTLNIQESDVFTYDEEMLVNEFKAIQKDYLYVKELEEIVCQMNIQEQHAIQQETPENLHIKVDSKVDHHPASSVNKKRTFFTQEEAERLFKEKERARECARMRMRRNRDEATRNLNSISDDVMMTAVLQSLGHPCTIAADLLSVYTLWLLTATKSHKNGRPMNRLALMNAFAVEYFSLARRGDNPPPSLMERD